MGWLVLVLCGLHTALSLIGGLPEAGSPRDVAAGIAGASFALLLPVWLFRRLRVLMLPLVMFPAVYGALRLRDHAAWFAFLRREKQLARRSQRIHEFLAICRARWSQRALDRVMPIDLVKDARLSGSGRREPAGNGDVARPV